MRRTIVRCPDLDELPPPPEGLTGWPWTVGSTRLSEGNAIGSLPRITVVTPSFNQARYLEATIRSILLQGYPDLEYILLDGGSTDASPAIIEKYAPWLAHWESGPDGGQSSAINKGIAIGSGEFSTWINSDDMLCQDALTLHATRVGFESGVVYVGICHHIDVDGNLVVSHQGRVHSLEDMVLVRDVWRSGGYIDQPATLFPRQLAVEVGGLNESNHRTMDYELWGRFFVAGARFVYTDVPTGMFRFQPLQKTGDTLEQTRSLVETATALITKSGGIPTDRQASLLEGLNQYHEEVQALYWRGTGRLARMGLPRWAVRVLRRTKSLGRRRENGGR